MPFLTMSSSAIHLALFLTLLLAPFSPVARSATVPSSAQFRYVNSGEFGEYIVEYSGDYRVLSPYNAPFQLCFYNTTSNAFTLALRMGTMRSESLRRWVWEANRGNPVGENATFSLGADGNLVLAHADGRVAWQSRTANKGVVGFQVLSNGNMVLVDSKGSFIWQSFDYPTDTLLAGQSLRKGAKLVSRASESVNADGAYSLVVESTILALYYQSKNSVKPYLYYKFDDLVFGNNTLQTVTFHAEAGSSDNHGADLSLEIENQDSSSNVNRILARPKYDATLSFLRLGIDGNLRIYTYDDTVDWGAWEVTYTLFSRDGVSECQLPERCGGYGLCSDNQCVACPSPNGLLGWSEECQPPKVPSCGSKAGIGYYKVQGVDHFMSTYTRGTASKESDCGKKCSSDCKCLGYFYNGDTSRCWIAYDLKTLGRAANATHVGYIKVPKLK